VKLVPQNTLTPQTNAILPKLTNSMTSITSTVGNNKKENKYKLR
jgi:hypothetical protein